MPYATDVVEAIHAAVSASSFPGSPDYAVNYVPNFSDEGQNASGTEIRVFLQGVTEFLRENRCNDFTKTYNIGVAIRKYIAPTSTGTVNDSAVATLLDAVEDLINTVATAGPMAGCRFVEVTQDQPFDFEVLHEKGIFQTLITFTYKG